MREYAEPPMRGEEPPMPGRGQPAMPQPGVAMGDFGSVAIKVQPAGAEIIVDGERWEVPAGDDRLTLDLSSGPHKIEIRKEGYKPVLRRGQHRSRPYVAAQCEPAEERLTARVSSAPSPASSVPPAGGWPLETVPPSHPLEHQIQRSRPQQREQRIGAEAGAIRGDERHVLARLRRELERLPHERVVGADPVVAGFDLAGHRLAEQQRLERPPSSVTMIWRCLTSIGSCASRQSGAQGTSPCSL